MAGRRRFRLLLIIVLLATGILVYTRRHSIDPVADYVRSNVVGGGSVLRGKPDIQRPAAPITTQPIRSRQTAAVRPTPPPSSHARFQDAGTTGVTSLASRPATTTDAAPTSTTVSHVSQQPLPPPILDYDDLPMEEGQGREDNPQLVPSASMVHWERHPEHFPVSTTIQLPYGSSKPFPRIQYKGKMEADKDRLAIIKAATKHAWDGYGGAAFAEDEVMPISGGFKNPFNGWGATLVDSLDTLWMMGMTAEFEEAVEAVRDIDFTTSMRVDIPLFETTIRYLGGLVGAYDISGAKYRVLLDKAVEIAEILFGVFDTPNRMPATFFRWKPAFTSQPHRASRKVILAELGTLSLEFTRLAQLTGEPKYYDAIARITDELVKWQNNTRLPGMWPSEVDASGCQKPPQAIHTPDGLQQWAPNGNRGTMIAGAPVAFGLEEILTPNAAKGTATVDTTRLESAQRNSGESGLDNRLFAGRASNDGEQKSTGLGSRKAKRQSDFGLETTGTAVKHAETPGEAAASDSTEQTGFLRPPAGPVTVDPEGVYSSQDLCIEQGLSSSSKYNQETFTLGGRSDSMYEYLPKQHILLGGLIEQYKQMYLDSAQTEIDNLIFRPMTPDNRDILMAGELVISVNVTDESLIKSFYPQNSHLTCFAGGMLAMGGRLFDRPEHVEIGWKLTDGCVWAYNATATGIMPESFMFVPCNNSDDCQWNRTEYWHQLDPYEDARTQIYDFWEAEITSTVLDATTAAATATESFATVVTGTAIQTSEVRLAEVKSQLSTTREAAVNPDGVKPRPTEAHLIRRQLVEEALDDPNTAEAFATTTSPSMAQFTSEFIWTAPTPLPHEEFVKQKIEDERLPPGMVRIVSHKYILRPEAIESVFYMYRITGDQYWRDVGWVMFTAIDKHTRAAYGNSAIDDVTKSAPDAWDAMESFWIAETLKYFYLLYDDGATWSLDDWVLNTEAHFFRRPKYQFIE